jgi:hypothetical protein
MTEPANGAPPHAAAEPALAALAALPAPCDPSATSLPGAAWRLGDATLAVQSADAALLQQIDELWRDCRERTGAAPAPLRVTCRVQALPTGWHRVEVASDEVARAVDTGNAPAVDLTGIARALLEPRPGDYVQAREAAGALVLVRKERPDVPLVAVAGSRAALATAALQPFFLRDFVVATALRAQTSVLFLHAASIAVGQRGVLLCGRAGAGKTTLAMALAARGHDLLGDDFAALRRPTRDLLPLRRTLHVRRGPRAADVDRALLRAGATAVVDPTGRSRLVAEPSRVFAVADPAPVRLGAAVFLRSFRRAPAIARFAPSRADLGLLRPLPIRHQWGIAAGPRLVRFLLLLELLAEIPCYLLDVAAPEPTADLLEATLRDPLTKPR